jgi:hypothetical protein
VAAASAPVAAAGIDAAAAVAQLKVAKMQMAELRVQLADARWGWGLASGAAPAAPSSTLSMLCGLCTRMTSTRCPPLPLINHTGVSCATCLAGQRRQRLRCSRRQPTTRRA